MYYKSELKYLFCDLDNTDKELIYLIH